MTDKMLEVTVVERERWERMVHAVRKVSRARELERNRIADAIEQLLYEAKTTAECNVLVRLAQIVLDPRHD